MTQRFRRRVWDNSSNSSPHNVNGSWPVSNNLYARLATDASGDAPASQDIVEISGTYKGDIAIDADGEEYTDVERVYFSMDLAEIVVQQVMEMVGFLILVHGICMA